MENGMEQKFSSTSIRLCRVMFDEGFTRLCFRPDSLESSWFQSRGHREPASVSATVTAEGEGREWRVADLDAAFNND